MYYHVGLYKYNHKEKRSDVVGDVIIKKGFSTVKEIFTGTELPIVKTNEKNGKLFTHDFLYVNEKSLINVCLASKQEVIDYVNSFNIDKFNKLLNTDYYYNLKRKKRIDKCLRLIETGVSKNE